MDTRHKPRPRALDFYHAAADCTDARYIQITGGAGFAYYLALPLRLK